MRGVENERSRSLNKVRNMTTQTRIPEILREYEKELLADWIREQTEADTSQRNMGEGELREQCKEFLRLLQEASQSNHGGDISTPAWAPVRELLGNISRSRGLQGAT